MRIVLVAIGLFVVFMGAVWTLQGVGVLLGSFMSNNITWAIIGPITVLVGLGVAYFGWRIRK